MKRVREVIVVEGKYDAIRLRSAVDATVVQTDGFGIFRDKEQLVLLRRMAQSRGLLILTDSDGAGFVIRNFLGGSIPAAQVKHAYVPELCGKERRKRVGSKEGLIGVEGMENAVILEALRRAGATFEDEPDAAPATGCALTKADFYAAGLSGTPDSAARRQLLQEALQLPKKMSANRLLDALNTAITPAEYAAALQAVNARLTPDG